MARLQQVIICISTPIRGSTRMWYQAFTKNLDARFLPLCYAHIYIVISEPVWIKKTRVWTKGALTVRPRYGASGHREWWGADTPPAPRLSLHPTGSSPCPFSSPRPGSQPVASNQTGEYLNKKTHGIVKEYKCAYTFFKSICDIFLDVLSRTLVFETYHLDHEKTLFGIII